MVDRQPQGARQVEERRRIDQHDGTRLRGPAGVGVGYSHWSLSLLMALASIRDVCVAEQGGARWRETMDDGSKSRGTPAARGLMGGASD